MWISYIWGLPIKIRYIKKNIFINSEFSETRGEKQIKEISQADEKIIDT